MRVKVIGQGGGAHALVDAPGTQGQAEGQTKGVLQGREAAGGGGMGSGHAATGSGMR